jgi:L,D-transpeptidase ErfK/SrfK
MRHPLLLVIMPLLLCFSACAAATPHYRNEASSALERIQQSAPPDPLYEEYNRIVESFSAAEQLWEQDRLEDADKIFHLVTLESSLYEKKLAALEQEPKAEPPPIRSGPAPSEMKISEERNIAPASSARQIPDDSEKSLGTQRMITGKKLTYVVRKGDTLRLIGAKFGVNWKLVARQNRINPKTFLKPGQKLSINTRRIIPKILQDGIVINIPDRTLYLFKNRKLEKVLPVALGMTKLYGELLWQTPTGKFKILSKIKDPAWHVPPSIQKEMELDGKTVITLVPPGDENPLGKYALKTSLPGILIHSTIAPESINSYSTHGCIRVLPANMEDIFDEVQINSSGEIIYQPVKIARSENGQIFLEVHQDVYDRHENLPALTKRLIAKNNLELLVDWNKVNASLRRKSGVPEDITGPTTPKQTITSTNPAPSQTPQNNIAPDSSSIAVRPIAN